MRICNIVAAGDITPIDMHIGDNDIVVAADGGFSICSALDIEPDYCIGDFDSISENDLKSIQAIMSSDPNRVIQLPREKDDTDTLAAIKLGLKLGYKDFRIYGAMGGRFDHTLANVQCLLYLKEQGATGYLLDGTGMMLVLRDEEISFKPMEDAILSLFALSSVAKGVSIKGMKYELENAVLTNSFPIGISNEFVGTGASISVENGELLAVITYYEE